MQDSGLTTFALVFMLVSMTSVTALAVYCYYRILTEPPRSEDSDGGLETPPVVL